MLAQAPELAAEHIAAEGDDPTVFTEIFQPNTNIAVWQRTISPALQQSIAEYLSNTKRVEISMTVSPESAYQSVRDSLGDAPCAHVLSEDIAQLVDMFCFLFELDRAGLRITALDAAMCPRFHFDRVPCRLVTTYQGVATQWLPHEVVDRSKLGHGSDGLPDEESGLIQGPDDIRQLTAGDVALLKGSLWEGNEEAGLVHRSPAVTTDERRLLLTLDFSN
ncbi:DUF1826 domain-containing protein [Maricurvus nonylphenolicus]|uniref:DUF1826 domain-containing protein n=1 Tax=Maricurvus nonylphenolicus TaxID=1008307 RepID=UPI0036F27A4D